MNFSSKNFEKYFEVKFNVKKNSKNFTAKFIVKKVRIFFTVKFFINICAKHDFHVSSQSDQRNMWPQIASKRFQLTK